MEKRFDNLIFGLLLLCLFFLYQSIRNSIIGWGEKNIEGVWEMDTVNHFIKTVFIDSKGKIIVK